MDVSSQVSVAALAVSLVALIVTLLQLLQQYFATADGYRRCAESVIGVWHKERKRRFVPSEFRFETEYVTPEITLYSPNELRIAKRFRAHYGGAFLLNTSNPEEPQFKLVCETVHPGCQAYVSQDKKRNCLLIIVVSFWRQCKRLMSKRKLSSATDEEKGKGLIWQGPQEDKYNELLVTWILLLKETHRLYSSYWPGVCPLCQGFRPAIGHDGQQTVENDDAQRDSIKLQAPRNVTDELDTSNLDRTDAAVIYRTWHWDFMPPDVSRPLAKSTVGDIVVLALRMGMQWRVLEPENYSMQADGHGYSLSATRVNGLGLVISLARFGGGNEKFPNLIPSRASDKLMCGIVPGDPQFVGQDFPLVNDKRQNMAVRQPGSILSKFGTPTEIIGYMNRHNWDEPHNELICLLLPFLPIPGSNMTGICFSRFRFSPNVNAVFYSWEGRHVLVQKLREKLDSKELDPSLRDILEDIWGHFHILQNEFPDNFYRRSDERYVVHHNSTANGKTLVERCREAFDFTSSKLESHKGEFLKNDDKGQRKYTHLVAAHVSMITYAITTAVNRVTKLREEMGKDWVQPEVRKRYRVPSPGGPSFSPDAWEYALQYVEGLHHKDHGVGSYLRRKGIELNTDGVETAWWLLMLRGVSICMAIWPGPYPGVPVQSSAYGNRTPVWIT